MARQHCRSPQHIVEAHTLAEALSVATTTAA